MRQLCQRQDHRLILHFDYDCFYAAVFEHEDPRLKSLPLAVQQKQIIVTCNYEARRRGLYKLQLIKEARQKCPEVIIVLGEDLTRFRNASKDNYDFLRSFSWNHKVDRLGFDEVFLDVTDIVDYNLQLLTRHDLTQAFFHVSRSDPCKGFDFNPTAVWGHAHPVDHFTASRPPSPDDPADLHLRLCLASHLAQYLRHELEAHKGYTSTVGISTTKLVSKLVGNVNKPKGQTTLLPPYCTNIHGQSNVHDFIDAHDIGQLPGIGFKTAQKIRSYMLERPAEFDDGLVYGGTKEMISVGDVRRWPDMGPALLKKILDIFGMPRDLPSRVWGLINGVDPSEVGLARQVPHQISIEDSYIRLDEIDQVLKELESLSTKLLQRLRLDLTEEDQGIVQWIAYPKTIRLSTRPRPPLKADGTRDRSFARISKSIAMPTFVLSLQDQPACQAKRLTTETLLSLFQKLHPQKSGWNLSLVNLCATNMVMTANDRRPGSARDIARMFRTQQSVLLDVPLDPDPTRQDTRVDPDLGQLGRDNDGMGHEIVLQQGSSETGSEDVWTSSQRNDDDERGRWFEDEDTGDSDFLTRCEICDAIMPDFAMIAHARFHAMI